MNISAQQQQLFYKLTLVAMLICAAFITYFYWNTHELDEIQQLPIYVLVFVLIYIVLNFFKKQLNNKQHWWDWTYYIALFAILLPFLKLDESYASILNYTTDIACLFLIFPVLMNGKLSLKVAPEKD